MVRMGLVICPGIHAVNLSEQFLLGLNRSVAHGADPHELRRHPSGHQPLSQALSHEPSGYENLTHNILVPTQSCPAYSPHHILAFVKQQLGLAATGWQAPLPNALRQVPLVWIGFSAGVVGAIGAARQWQRLGGQVKAVIALDGWGVPLAGNFPIHRLSHDVFTHWSSAFLGGESESFYANPSVSHLELWASPQQVEGVAWLSDRADPIHQSRANPLPRSMTAADFLNQLLSRYGEAIARADISGKY